MAGISGREENTYKIEAKIERDISSYPEILSEYYYSMDRNTPVTKRAYIGYLMEYFDYIREKTGKEASVEYFDSAKPYDINYYMNTIKYNKEGKLNHESIRACKLFAIKSFYKFLFINGLIKSNPCNFVVPPKVTEEKEVIRLESEDKKNILNCIRQENDKYGKQKELIFVLGWRTGLRVTEMVEINISDIDFQKKTIKVTTKGNKKRIIDIENGTIEYIKDWMTVRNSLGIPDDCDALFVSDRKRRLTVRSVERYVSKYSSMAGRNDITPHKLRSTFGSDSYDATGDVYLVASLLGHSSPKTTTRYAAVSEKKKRSVAILLDQEDNK